MKIGDGDFFSLSSFAGCTDKILGVEYEDCYFATHDVSPQLTQWLNDAVSGANAIRNAVVVERDSTGTVIAQLDIQNAFLDDFAVADIDGSTAAGTLTFTAVPEHLATASPSSIGLLSAANRFLNDTFSLNITSVDGSRVVGVRGIHMSAPKILTTGGLRHEFIQGAAQFDPIRVEVSTTSGASSTTISDITSWVTRVAEGLPDSRDGDLNLFTPTMTATVATVQFQNLVPTSFDAFSTVTNRRTLTLAVGSFTIH